MSNNRSSVLLLLLWSLEIEDDEGMMVQTHSHASVTHELFMLLEIELPDFKVTEEGFLRVPILPDLAVVPGDVPSGFAKSCPFNLKGTRLPWD